MEYIMSSETMNRTYFELSIPGFLKDSIKNSETSIKENFFCWDICYGTLQSNISIFKVEDYIAPNQAWLLKIFENCQIIILL